MESISSIGRSKFLERMALTSKTSLTEGLYLEDSYTVTGVHDLSEISKVLSVPFIFAIEDRKVVLVS